MAKVRGGQGASVQDLTEQFPVTVESPFLASRGIYLLRPTDQAVASDVRRTAKLAKEIGHSDSVEYAEPNYATDLADQRYHSWPQGSPEDAGTDPDSWTDQPLSQDMRLADVHRASTGAGTVVAVLDTGVDPHHPALRGRLVRGYDYLADDADPTEERMGLDCDGDGIVDGAFGHGTFVAGMVSLVAPDARVLPMRVLDSDGSGNIFLVAEAIADAVAAGADVVNLSLGTAEKLDSHLLEDILELAHHKGVVVVAAAGNSASDTPEYPAKDHDVLSVTSVNTAMDDLSTFAAWGDWVDVAAPADSVVGPVPGGRYALWAGTSMAAPQISGQVALLRSRMTRMKTDKLVGAITRSARKVQVKKKLKYGAVDLIGSLRRAARD